MRSPTISRSARIEQLLEQPGATAASIADVMSKEGYASASRASIGRELAKLRGARRLSRRNAKRRAAAKPPSGRVQRAGRRVVLDLKSSLRAASQMAEEAKSRGDTVMLKAALELVVKISEAMRKAKASSPEERDGYWVSRADAEAAKATLLEKLERLASADEHSWLPTADIAAEVARSVGTESGKVVDLIRTLVQRERARLETPPQPSAGAGERL